MKTCLCPPCGDHAGRGPAGLGHIGGRAHPADAGRGAHPNAGLAPVDGPPGLAPVWGRAHWNDPVGLVPCGRPNGGRDDDGLPSAIDTK